MIWAAYLAIPVILVYFARKRQEVPFRNLFWLFGAFIIFCGSTHFVDFLTFQYPAYRFLGLMKALTALVSCATVMVMIPLAPRALSMRFPEELEREVEERKRAEAALTTLNAELEKRIEERTALATRRAQELDEAQRVLAEKTEILEAILENLSEGVVVMDAEENYVHTNSVARLLVPALEVRPKNMQSWGESHWAEDETGERIPPSQMPLIRAVRERVAVDGSEIKICGPTSARWLRVSARPLPDEIGGAVAVLHDTTQLRDQLRQITEARDEAVRANSVKSEFLAMMSHELRTPLNGVRGMLELLEETRLDKKQKDFAETALSCSNTLLHLIDDLLDISKIEAGKLGIHTKSFSPRGMLHDIESVFRPALADSEVQLECVAHDSLPEYVLGDQPRIVQILTNLIGNAIKYSETGTVSVRASYEMGSLNMEVRDEGPGIPEEFHETLFSPFTQVDSSMARRHGGVGLGLAIVHRLVGLLDGTLQFESQQGVGTRFQVALPVPESEGPLIVADDTQPVDLSTRSVLVVEDNPINRRVVRLQLQKLSVGEALVAEDGETALQTLSQRSVDLVLLDCQMPGLDGIEVARRLRADRKTFGSPVIVALTAHALNDERERCLEAGMDDFLSKPLAFKELEITLKRWLK